MLERECPVCQGKMLMPFGFWDCLDCGTMIFQSTRSDREVVVSPPGKFPVVATEGRRKNAPKGAVS